MTEAQFAIAAMEPYSVSYPVVYDRRIPSIKHVSRDQLAALGLWHFAAPYSRQAIIRWFIPAKTGWSADRGNPYDKWIAQYNTVCEYPNPAFCAVFQQRCRCGHKRQDVTISPRDYPT